MLCPYLDYAHFPFSISHNLTDFLQYLIGQGIGLMVFKDMAHLIARSGITIGAAVQLPCAAHPAVNQFGIGLLAHVRKGMCMGQKVAKGTTARAPSGGSMKNRLSAGEFLGHQPSYYASNVAEPSY